MIPGLLRTGTVFLGKPRASGDDPAMTVAKIKDTV